MKNEFIRTFLAIELGSHFGSEIDTVIQTVATHRTKIKWIRSDQAHITVHFFGDLSLSEVERVKLFTQECLAGHTPFQLGLKGVGAFPSVYKPRVIWIGLDGEVDALCSLKINYDAYVKQHNYPVEKRVFHPHLTIGRIKYFKRDEELTKKLSMPITIPDKRINIKELILFQSVLTPHGPLYKRLETFLLTR